MKRVASIGLLLVIAAMFTLPNYQAAAQSPKIKRVGRSLNQLGSGGKWSISSGLRAVGRFSRSYWSVDTTGTNVVDNPAWSIVTRPAGSTAAFDSADGKFINSLKTDVQGQFIVSVTYGGTTVYDTIQSSIYVGVGSDPEAGCPCHNDVFAPGDARAIKSSWAQSPHAVIFAQGVTGQLEVDATINKGSYALSCVQCHTIGWEPGANNGNFGYVAHQVPAASPSSWDSTWFAGLQWTPDGRDVLISYQDSTIYKNLPSQLKPLGYIGCESCHGPAYDHRATMSRLAIGKSLDASLCNMCHDGSTRHTIGSYFNMSGHATLASGTPPGGHATSASCAPCHTGKGFVYYAEHGKDTTGIAGIWDSSFQGSPIACAVCHDPHGNSNEFQLRVVALDSLRNGYRIPAGQGGLGQMCANCHNSRYSVNKKVTTKAPYYGFSDRFGPHDNPQGDMYFGSNGYQYGDNNLTGIGTHLGLENGCVTCHMQDRMRYTNGKPNNNPQANHSFSMADTAWGFDPVAVCRPCHGNITDFNDVKASYDYDQNGVIEGVQTEILGLLNRLKARLPIDASTGDVITMMKDSLAIKNRPDLVQAIWNYWFVKNDKSNGIHNAHYAVSLLQKAMGIYPLDVKKNDLSVPREFALNQNYPNPFNPSTQISFSLPKSEYVKLEVYDMVGRLVKSLASTTMSAGNFTLTWDGNDQNGVRVASGMYLYRLQAGSFTSVKKMLLLK